MAIPNSILETWSHRGSVTQSRDTYAPIKRALEASTTAYSGRGFEVFLQGSYGNHTNIYSESDVDVVIRLDDTYHYDISALAAHELAAFNASSSPATYSYAEFKRDVTNALNAGFGSANVQPGTKAIKIKAAGGRRCADVIIATQFRRYYSSLLGPQFTSGICFFTPDGTRITNYPKQHSANCTTKHQATNDYFKPMVRILKNMRSKLVETGKLQTGAAPSYFIESLLYNAPNETFGTNYSDTFVAAVSWLQKAQRNEFVCPSGQFYLAHDSAPECWPRANRDSFLDAIGRMWNGWT
jgi:hypothetical protein